MTRPRTPTPRDGVAWITGASSGIGEHLALRLAADGWTVVASARRADALADVAARAKGPGRIVPLAVDVTDLPGMRAAAQTIRADHGPIALCVLNAGTYKPDSAKSLDAEVYRRTIDINVMGVVNGLDAVLPDMIARRAGHIAVVSSVAGYRGLPRSLAYGASKAALINLTESLKLDVERYGIKVQVVNPGFIKTPLTDRNDFPMPFLMPVEDATEAFARGLRSDAFEIVFPKSFAFLLQRLRCLPYSAYFALARRAVPK